MASQLKNGKNTFEPLRVLVSQLAFCALLKLDASHILRQAYVIDEQPPD